MLATENQYFKMLLDEAKYALESGGSNSYVAMLETYDRQKLVALLGLLSYEPFRQDMLRQLYDCNEPKNACDLWKEIGYALLVHPADLGWFSNNFYTRKRVLAARYKDKMIDRRALGTAKRQLRTIEREARRKLNETRIRKRRIWRLPLLR